MKRGPYKNRVVEREPRLCDCGRMGFIHLTRGMVAFFDPEDAPKLAGRKWTAYRRATGDFLAGRLDFQGKVKRPLYMARFLLDAPPGSVVDHWNHDTLDNRKNNLRLCTHANNMQNQITSKGSSQFKGVQWYAPLSKWRAAIGKNGTRYHLGYFSSERAAARAYDRAAVRLFGEYALTNKAIQARKLRLCDQSSGRSSARQSSSATSSQPEPTGSRRKQRAA